MDRGETFRNFLLQTNPFQQYLYSYPHKSAYRKLNKSVDLKKLWSSEKKNSLYLYTHIPFCQSKCSFCNLFSVSSSSMDLIDTYLDTLEIEAETTKDILGNHSFSGYAIGGGTPSILSTQQLEKLFHIYIDTLNVNMKKLPGSFELSPNTVTKEKLNLIYNTGVDRVSIGVQSFIESEAKLLGRHYPKNSLMKVLKQIASYNFPTFNIDLIYGIQGQTIKSLIASLNAAIECNPNEIFLYPLYTRPFTPLFSNSLENESSKDNRMKLYVAAREFLLEKGFEQHSMRMFSLPTKRKESSYSCQEDGMIGLGVNARSYTKGFHYSTEYAVTRNTTLGIIDQYISQRESDFFITDYGIKLSVEEQKRRFIIKSLLKADGMDLNHYKSLYNFNPLSEYPELETLVAMELATTNSDILQLNKDGLALSDLIGYWFISDEIKARMQEYTLR